MKQWGKSPHLSFSFFYLFSQKVEASTRAVARAVLIKLLKELTKLKKKREATLGNILQP